MTTMIAPRPITAIERAADLDDLEAVLIAVQDRLDVEANPVMRARLERGAQAIEHDVADLLAD